MSEQVQVGQKGSLKELEYGFELVVVPPDQPGSVIAEVAPDHIVLDDADAGVSTRVPAYLIKAVILPEGMAPLVPVAPAASVAAPVLAAEPEAEAPVLAVEPEVAPPPVPSAA
jgi:hypothetical protein